MSGTFEPHPNLKPGEKCCCGYEAPKPPPPPKPRVNNIQVLASQFCCGMSELGNFNYVDPPGGKKMTHYHRVGGWQVQKNEEPTTKEDIVQRMGYVDGIGALVCTTGAGQEYLDPILTEIGWDHVFTFVNPGHARTPVKVWLYSKHKVKDAP